MNKKTTKDYIYGVHAVMSALQKNAAGVTEVRLAGGGGKNNKITEIEELSKVNNISVHKVSHDQLDELTEGARHQGVVATCVSRPTLREHDLETLLEKSEGPAFLLVLDGVQDPHNLGACLRTVDAVGAHGVIVPKDKAVGITPVVSKVACGAAETVPLFQVTNLARTLRYLKDAGVWIMGADERAEATLYQTDLTGPLALVLGAEGTGLRRLTREHCDVLFSIPMAGAVESLNVSVATGVCLYEASRQRLLKK